MKNVISFTRKPALLCLLLFGQSIGNFAHTPPQKEDHKLQPKVVLNGFTLPKDSMVYFCFCPTESRTIDSIRDKLDLPIVEWYVNDRRFTHFTPAGVHPCEDASVVYVWIKGQDGLYITWVEKRKKNIFWEWHERETEETPHYLYTRFTCN